MRGNGVYEDIMDFKALKTFMEERLEDYNMEPGVISMDLVLFRDAIEHGKWNSFLFFFQVNRPTIFWHNILRVTRKILLSLEEGGKYSSHVI